MTLNEAKYYVVHVKVLFIPSGCLILSPNVKFYTLEDHYIQKWQLFCMCTYRHST